MYSFARLHVPFPRHVAIAARRSFVCSAQPLDFVTPPRSLEHKRMYVVLSDLHVKRETVSTCLQALQIAHSEAVKRNAGILFLGDWWHARGALPVEPLNLVLKELETWSVPVVMIPGNHDLISRTGNGVSLVPLATTLGADNCLLVTRPTVCLDALFLPYMHDVPRLKAALHHARHCLDDISAVFCHAEVAGARLADKVISSASSRSVRPSDFPPKLPVYSGHLHRPHTVSDNIRYVGSPYQVSASEQGQEKRLLVLDRKAGWTVVDSIPIDIGPRHLTINAQSADALPEIRPGDRVIVQTTSQHDDKLKDLVSDLRARGTRVEVQLVNNGGESYPMDELSDSDPFAPSEPRISPGALSNIDLFHEYATIKNLEPQVTQAGKEIIREVGNKTAQASISGKDVTIYWESVTLRGFGSFLSDITYPLNQRGLVLVTGRDCSDDGVATGRTNGTGKTTLIMAPLWALTGRTDARPDGSVEKGVSLEMVHDDAKECEVTVRVRLKGNRVFSEIRDIMTVEEREEAGLSEVNDVDEPQALQAVVTRTSSRVGTLTKTRSYRQGLHLTVNGVDLTCLEVKETQNRIDRLINGMLLPHTVFFGQHMGAGRGLVDSTDRTLKDHLSLVFPLDIWREARKKAREKGNKLQELLATSEATLEAAKSHVARLIASEASSRQLHETFEAERRKKVAALDISIAGLLLSYCRHDEDSVSYAESFPFDSTGLLARIDDCRRTIRSLDDRTILKVDNSRAVVAASVARATAALRSAEDLYKRVSYLAEKSEQWESHRQEKMNSIHEYISSVQSEMDKFDSPAVLDQSWKKAVEEMNYVEQRESTLQLVSVNVSHGGTPEAPEFTDEIGAINGAWGRISAVQEESVRLRTSLHEIRERLQSSEAPSLVPSTVDADGVGAANTSELPSLSAVACESCLRPFDGHLYVQARSRLEEEAANMEVAVRGAEKKLEDEKSAYEQAVLILKERVEKERGKAQEKKALIGNVFKRIREQRDTRSRLNREVQELNKKKDVLASERNLYRSELEQLARNRRELKDAASGTIESVQNVAKTYLDQCQDELAHSKSRHEVVVANLKAKERERLFLFEKKKKIQADLDDLLRLQVSLASLENEKTALQSELNPYNESLRMISDERIEQSEKVAKREKEFSNLKDTLNVLKYLDVAFGPRGVPSFVLEEGLLWLEKLTGLYLHKLSAGELMLQIRAFSDYKSSNRVDGENKEVISKKVFIRKPGASTPIRERSLRQLSGGQRRRCSLAFALAFADLAHDRAGFQSSLLVMDEILQSLDEDGRQRISKLIPDLIGDDQAIRDTVLVVAQDEAPEIAGLAHGGIDVVVLERDESRVLFESQQQEKAL